MQVVDTTTTQAVNTALHCGESHTVFKFYADVPTRRDALRCLLAASGALRKSYLAQEGARPLVFTDSVALGEEVVGFAVGVDVALVRRDDRGVDADHLRELLRPHNVHHGASSRPLLGCFVVARGDGTDDLSPRSWLTRADTRSSITRPPGSSPTWTSIAGGRRASPPGSPGKRGARSGGDVVGEGFKFGHAYRAAAYVDLAGRIPGVCRVLAVRDYLYWP